MAHKQESPEQKFALEMKQLHGRSAVRLQMIIHDKHNIEMSFTGSGFIVFVEQDLCLIMSCGHNFEGYRAHNKDKDAIYVVFPTYKLKAELIFTDVEKEVFMIQVGRNQINSSQFNHLCSRSAIDWSSAEAALHELVVILSYMNDPEGNPIHKPSVYCGSVIRGEGVISFGATAVKHNVTADYACVQGNSGSPVVNGNGMVGIHMGGTSQLAYFISLRGVRVVLKEQVTKISPKNSDAIPDLIGIIAQVEKAKQASASKQPSGGGKGPGP